MTDNLESNSNTSFAKEIAKDIGVAAAQSVASYAIAIGILAAAGAVINWREKRQAKKNPTPWLATPDSE